MIRSPWLAGTAIASPAIGIAATTAVFTVINAALLETLLHPVVDRLITVTRGDSRYFSVSEYRDLEAGVTTIEHLSAVEMRDFVLGGDGQPEQAQRPPSNSSFVRGACGSC